MSRTGHTKTTRRCVTTGFSTVQSWTQAPWIYRPFSYATVDYPWNLEFERHEFLFVLEPEKVDENHLMIHTDAITIGFYVEKEMYDYFDEHQCLMGQGRIHSRGGRSRQISILKFDVCRTSSTRRPHKAYSTASASII